MVNGWPISNQDFLNLKVILRTTNALDYGNGFMKMEIYIHLVITIMIYCKEFGHLHMKMVHYISLVIILIQLKTDNGHILSIPFKL